MAIIWQRSAPCATRLPSDKAIRAANRIKGENGMRNLDNHAFLESNERGPKTTGNSQT